MGPIFGDGMGGQGTGQEGRGGDEEAQAPQSVGKAPNLKGRRHGCGRRRAQATAAPSPLNPRQRAQPRVPASFIARGSRARARGGGGISKQLITHTHTHTHIHTHTHTHNWSYLYPIFHYLFPIPEYPHTLLASVDSGNVDGVETRPERRRKGGRRREREGEGKEE